MKIFFLSRLAVVLVLIQFTTIIRAQNISDSTAIQNILQEEIVSWNNGDAETYSKHFDTEGTFTNILGLFFTGHKEFLVRHEQIFKGVFLGTALKQNIVSLKFVSPDVAVVETLTWISGFSKDGPPKGTYLDDKGRLRTRLLQVMVRNSGGWKIVVYHNVDIKPGVPAPDPR
jgi:uncharacterized protein (TIGR02246 family)